ncbi:MAG: HK97 gp10 family phage protein [Rhizobiaceae bacterium]|nr:HK97 gp10 family phage protein [Rhizobiaceae bacterium]
MSSSSFSSSVADWVRRTKQTMEDVVHLSSERLAEAVVAGTPEPNGALAASFQASGSSMPVMRAAVSTGDGFDAGAFSQAILGIPFGGSIYMGFTAPYAAKVEYGVNSRNGYGMVRLAAQRWPDIVEQAATETK